MTHDLLASMVRALDARVAAVKVSELRGNTFYAIIYLERDGETLEVDARPSDAIALALRTESPIFVAQEVLEQAHQVRIRSESGPEAQDGEEAPAAEGEQPEQPPSGPRPLDPNTPPDKWTEILENLDPEAFGKYKM